VRLRGLRAFSAVPDPALSCPVYSRLRLLPGHFADDLPGGHPGHPTVTSPQIAAFEVLLLTWFGRCEGIQLSFSGLLLHRDPHLISVEGTVQNLTAQQR